MLENLFKPKNPEKVTQIFSFLTFTKYLDKGELIATLKLLRDININQLKLPAKGDNVYRQKLFDCHLKLENPEKVRNIITNLKSLVQKSIIHQSNISDLVQNPEQVKNANFTELVCVKPSILSLFLNPGLINNRNFEDLVNNVDFRELLEYGKIEILKFLVQEKLITKDNLKKLLENKTACLSDSYEPEIEYKNNFVDLISLDGDVANNLKLLVQKKLINIESQFCLNNYTTLRDLQDRKNFDPDNNDQIKAIQALLEKNNGILMPILAVEWMKKYKEWVKECERKSYIGRVNESTDLDEFIQKFWSHVYTRNPTLWTDCNIDIFIEAMQISEWLKNNSKTPEGKEIQARISKLR